jgi:4-amino-4-deoxy-L-arabinose transferase-like glycosyltransferase
MAIFNSIAAKDRTETAAPNRAPDPGDEAYPYQFQLFVLLMLLSTGLRLCLLFTSRHYLNSDTAATAMMALDILDGEPIPFFFYGQPYGGGHTVEALMAVPWFAIFGPSDYLFKLGPALLSCVYILVVYLTLYRFFNKRYALIATAAFSMFPTFLAFNFDYTGELIMSFFGWLGLYFFFCSYFAARERHSLVALSGMAIGFAYYCFDYGLYYLVAVLALWILKESVHLWRRWRSILRLLIGFLIGASPLIYYNLTHDFENFKFLLWKTARPDPVPVLGSLSRFARLLTHDLPAVFSLDIDDFLPQISWVSYLSYGFFVISALYVLIRTKPALFSIIRSFFARRVAVLVSEDRVVYNHFLIILNLSLYYQDRSGGNAPRYLVVLCPLIPLILVWAAFDLGKRRLIPATIFTALFLALQIPFMIQLATDKTVPEWEVRTHGEDMRALAKFLLDNNLTTVVTPYEIKWKLMFESRRRVVCAAYLFGFDREDRYNLEVIDRVNRKGVSPAFVFDKEYKLAKVALRFNPRGAFDVDGFHEFLRKNRIRYQVTPVGQDYIIYHGFSKHFALADPYRG